MAQGFGTFRLGTPVDGTIVGRALVPANVDRAKKISFVERFDLSLSSVKKVVADNNVICKMPKGFVPTSIKVRSTVSLTTSQLSFGIAGTTAKYGSAAAYGTTAEVEKQYLLTSKAGVELTADETLIMTIGTADLPGAGTIFVEVEGNAKA